MSDGSLKMRRAGPDDAASDSMREKAPAMEREQSAFPFDDAADDEPHALAGADPVGREPVADTAPLESSRALALADFSVPRTGPLDAILRWAYRVGMSPSLLASPLRKPSKPRLLATVDSPLSGEGGLGGALADRRPPHY